MFAPTVLRVTLNIGPKIPKLSPASRYLPRLPRLGVPLATTRIMSTYRAQTPREVSEEVKTFYESFYAVSDNSDPSTHEQYANAFTKDGTLVMGLKTVTGYDEILELRKGLWAGPVVSRLHTLEKIYPFGDNGMDVMLFGNVKYGLKNGKTVFVEWAGRAMLVENDGDVKMKFYQVYLDSSVVANAMKD